VLVRLVRHATLVVQMAGVRLIVDPMLGPAGSKPPIPDTANPVANPLVELPISIDSAVAGVQAVLISHLHPDHIDVEALQALAGDLPVLCQPNDAPLLARQERSDLRPLTGEAELGPIRVTRTGGQHGHGAIARELGPVSGFVLSAEGEPTLYIAGDSVWCPEVAAAIEAHAPDVIVVNAGGARFLAGDPITMDAPDVASVCRAAPDALVVAVHMDAINHCGVTRHDLRAALTADGLADQVSIPADGETLSLELS
jgi:L-ascorbate metabolism protein UlaG (beta-lactamase superfamily)